MNRTSHLLAGSSKALDSRTASESDRSIEPVESCLLSLCREVAGALLRGTQEGKEPRAWREAVETALQERTGLPPKQVWSLVELSLELIRAQQSGSYRRDDVGLERLVTVALGGTNAEGWN